MAIAIAKDGFLSTALGVLYSPSSGSTAIINSIHFNNTADTPYKIWVYQTRRGSAPSLLYTLDLEAGDFVIDGKNYELSGGDVRLDAKASVQTVSFSINGSLEDTRTFAGRIVGNTGGTVQVFDKNGQIKEAGGGSSSPINSITLALEFVIDGGGIPIQGGIKGDLKIPFDCVIQSSELVGDRVGSIVMDVWKSDFINFPPVVGNSITGTAKPTLTNAIKSLDSTLAGWNRNIANGSWLRYNVVSSSIIQIATLSLAVVKT